MEWKFGGNQLEPVLGPLDDAGLGGRGSQMTSLGKRDPWSPTIVGSSSCFPVCHCPHSAALSTHGSPWIHFLKSTFSCLHPGPHMAPALKLARLGSSELVLNQSLTVFFFCVTVTSGSSELEKVGSIFLQVSLFLISENWEIFDLVIKYYIHILQWKVKVKLLSSVRLFVTLWTVAHQAPLSMEFSRQEYWSGLPFPSPGDLPNPGIKPRSPTLQADALTSELPGNVSYL